LKHKKSSHDFIVTACQSAAFLLLNHQWLYDLNKEHATKKKQKRIVPMHTHQTIARHSPIIAETEKKNVEAEHMQSSHNTTIFLRTHLVISKSKQIIGERSKVI
jgi:hypothetical protein